MTPALNDLLDVAIEAAYLGGKRTLAYFNTGVVVETKSDNTPVTCADREGEIVIRDRILRSFPTHSILGEEGGRFFTWEGRPTMWGKDAAATNSALYREVSEILRSERRK